MLEDILKAIGAGDSALRTMGPVLTILLAWIAGGALAQFLKYPISRAVLEGAAFDWTVRAVAVASTFGFAHILSGSVTTGLELVAAVSQPIAYWASLRVVRRFWPWLEVHPAVGSCTPPQSAYDAAVERRADQTGERSGV